MRLADQIIHNVEVDRFVERLTPIARQTAVLINVYGYTIIEAARILGIRRQLIGDLWADIRAEMLKITLSYNPPPQKHSLR